MRAVAYRETGGTDVLSLVERTAPEPAPGEVLVRVAVSGVNPTDWKARQGPAPGQALAFPMAVPHHDGAGTVVAVGQGVDPAFVGRRVWLWEAAWRRPEGTAQELVALPVAQAVPLASSASFDLGASLGVPALTAHRCLTVGAGGTTSLARRPLEGRRVLVAGGAGAVGHMAVQLALWAGAHVITTVSSPAKADLARAAGAHHVVYYNSGDAAGAILAVAPLGIDIVVEVNPAVNAALDQRVLSQNGAIASYASTPSDLRLDVRASEAKNASHHFVMVFGMPGSAKIQAIEDISAALEAGALRVGAENGLPVHRFHLHEAAAAHAAGEGGVVGKVLIDLVS
jgi:NADPH2:quinone reductase